MDGHTLTKTFDCKTPDCTGTATSNVGRYSYCATCRERRASLSTAQGQVANTQKRVATGTLAAQVKDLEKAAKNADKLAAHAKKLTERALAAKKNADDAAERVKQIARELYA